MMLLALSVIFLVLGLKQLEVFGLSPVSDLPPKATWPNATTRNFPRSLTYTLHRPLGSAYQQCCPALAFDPPLYTHHDHDHIRPRPPWPPRPPGPSVSIFQQQAQCGLDGRVVAVDSHMRIWNDICGNTICIVNFSQWHTPSNWRLGAFAVCQWSLGALHATRQWERHPIVQISLVVKIHDGGRLACLGLPLKEGEV